MVSPYEEADMEPMAQFAVLTVATVIALALAFALAWAFLLGAFQLMEPAAARPQAGSTARQSRSELIRGPRAIAQQFAAHR
jgi:hypothetical protein